MVQPYLRLGIEHNNCFTYLVISDRALLSRYFHRFAFGPKPEEFKSALALGADNYFGKLLDSAPVSKIPDPTFELLGPIPQAGSILRGQWQIKMQAQRVQLAMWWLDRMADVENPLTERMVWFWHGHWATSLSKVEYATAMYVQNKIFRNNALGDFRTQSQKMIMDGALQFWLDNNYNSVKAPNENLARELMELFILGVNRYTEDDVKQAARALTGYSLDRESGVVTYDINKHDAANQNILGNSANYNAQSLTDFLISQDSCEKFIPERLWYRFINDQTPPTDTVIKQAFKNRNIKDALRATASHPELRNEANSMVKPPLEWFIGACRALNILPSQVAKPETILNYLDKLGQKPFYPPNVGGWPSGEIWLTAANAQYRIELATILVKASDKSVLTNVIAPLRITALADLLGIGAWRAQTKTALVAAQMDVERMLITALCAPDYVVNS